MSCDAAAVWHSRVQASPPRTVSVSGSFWSSRDVDQVVIVVTAGSVVIASILLSIHRAFSIPTPIQRPSLYKPNSRTTFPCLPTSSSPRPLYVLRPHISFEKMFASVKLVTLAVLVAATGAHAQSASATPSAVPGISPCALTCIQQSLPAGNCSSLYVPPDRHKFCPHFPSPAPT